MWSKGLGDMLEYVGGGMVRGGSIYVAMGKLLSMLHGDFPVRLLCGHLCSHQNLLVVRNQA